MDEYDYNLISAEFGRLSKPAKRALLDHGVHGSADLAKHTFKEIEKWHGLGAAGIRVLAEALARAGLTFREESSR